MSFSASLREHTDCWLTSFDKRIISGSTCVDGLLGRGLVSVLGEEGSLIILENVNMLRKVLNIIIL